MASPDIFYDDQGDLTVEDESANDTEFVEEALRRPGVKPGTKRGKYN